MFSKLGPNVHPLLLLTVVDIAISSTAEVPLAIAVYVGWLCHKHRHRDRHKHIECSAIGQ